MLRKIGAGLRGLFRRDTVDREIALDKAVSEKAKADPKLWAECVVGAITEDDYGELLRAAGLSIEVLSEMDYFAGSASASTRRAAHGLGAHAIVMRGCKPDTGM